MSLTKVYWLHALTGVHVGAGTGVGFVDLPILREKVTEWPYIPGSSVKGVMAAKYHPLPDEEREGLAKAAFGKADPNNEMASNSGALVYTDARLVCLPVASFYGTFAWATSALALRRLARDLATAGIAPKPLSGSPEKALLAKTSVLSDGAKVFLSDLDFEAESGPAEEWAALLAAQIFDGEWQAEFKKRFVILPENHFNHLCRNGCEVIPRVRIAPDRKTVEKGALWLEECLPAESILSGVAWCDRVYGKDTGITQKAITDEYWKDQECMQFGGKGTVGRGRMRVRFRGGAQ